MELPAEISPELIELGISWGLKVIAAIAILIVGRIVGKWLAKRIGNIEKLDSTLQTFLGKLAKYTILAIAGITVIGLFGIPMASLLAVMGAAGLAIGLALQGTLSNVAAGVMMLILRPFSVGDYIEYGGTGGVVSALGLFGTELTTLDNRYIFAPNSTIWGSEVVNFTRNKQRRQDISVGVSYDTDLNKAFKTIETVLKKEKRLITTKGKEPIIAVEAMADSSVNIKVRIWTKIDDFFGVQWDFLKNVKEALDKDGISIPFPTRTLEISNPEALANKSSKAA